MEELARGAAATDPAARSTAGPTEAPIAGPAGPAAATTADSGSRVRPPTPRVALLMIAAVIVATLLYLGRDALTPFIVGLIGVYLLDPPVERLSRVRVGRLRVPRWLAILLVYAAAILVVAEVLNLTLQPLIGQLGDFVGNLPQLAKSLDATLRRITESYRGLALPPAVRDVVDQVVAEARTGAVGLDPVAILLPVFRSVASIVTTVFGFFVVPFWVFYILKDRPSLTASFDAAVPAEWRPDVRSVARIVGTVFGRWVRGQLLLGLTVGAATFAGLIALDLLVDPVFGRFAVLFAVLAGLLELLPIVGPIISAVPPLLVALTVSPTAVVATLLLYFGIQQVENTILVPKIQGDAVELHPSAVVFALIVGGSIAGLLGAILALPITAAARDVYRYLFRRLGPEPRPGAEEAAAGVLGSSVAKGSGAREVPAAGHAAVTSPAMEQAAVTSPAVDGRPGEAPAETDA